MNALRYVWFIIGLFTYPLRFVLYTLHRLFVFLSKEGARWIIPLVLLTIGMLMRARIDAYAGVGITDFYQDFGEPFFSFRIEITFAILFLLLFFSLKIVALVMSPIVGAFPAPSQPLRPMTPLIVQKHSIREYPAKLAVSAPRKGYFNGKLGKLDRYLPAHIRPLLKAGAQASIPTAMAAPPPALRRETANPPDRAPALRSKPGAQERATRQPPPPPARDISPDHHDIPTPHRPSGGSNATPTQGYPRPSPSAAPRIQGREPPRPEWKPSDDIEPPRSFGRPPQEGGGRAAATAPMPPRIRRPSRNDDLPSEPEREP